MKAARLHSYNQSLLVEEIPEPKIEGPSDVIVRIGAAGVCRSDLHVIGGLFEGAPGHALPLTLGHENAGWVEAVGSSVTAVRPGDTVVAHPAITCGVCPGCRRGEDLHCESAVLPGATAEGGFADYLRTTERSLVKIDPELDPKDVAPLADAGLTVYHACKKGAGTLSPGTRCVVVGVGGLGHLAIQCLRTMCATEIIAADISEAACQLAEEVGADLVVQAGEGLVDRVLSATGGLGVDAVFDFVGEKGVPDQVPPLLRQGGTYYVIGIGGTVSIPNWEFVIRELNVVGNCIGTHTDLIEVMALAARGKVTVHTRQYRLEDVNQAIADLQEGRLAGRGVLVP